MYPYNPIRLAVSFGVLLGILVLAAIFYFRTRSNNASLEKASPPPVVQPGANPKPLGDAQAAVLHAIRILRPNEKVEIAKWWPPKRMMMEQAERVMCRAIYRVEGEEQRFDGAFALEGDSARPLWGGPESVETHRYLDQFFPCEKCLFAVAPGKDRRVSDELRKLNGAWEVMKVAGIDVALAEKFKGSRWVIRDGMVTGKLPGGPDAEQFDIEVNTTTRPKQADIRLRGTTDPLVGVYNLDNGELTMCWGPLKAGRPKRLDAPGAGQILVQLVSVAR